MVNTLLGFYFWSFVAWLELWRRFVLLTHFQLINFLTLLDIEFPIRTLPPLHPHIHIKLSRKERPFNPPFLLRMHKLHLPKKVSNNPISTHLERKRLGEEKC